MEIRILGPLTVHGSAPATPTAPKPRSVLSLLLLHANQTVPVSDLVRELWDADPPASALTTLQTYVLQLRKRLSSALRTPSAEVAGDVLVTVPGGYQFRCGADSYDLPRFQRLADQGRRELAVGDDATAADLLSRALAEWRGPALSDVPPGPVLRPQVKRLQESYVTTVEQTLEAKLRLGRHQEVVSELAGLTAQYSLHENFHALYMVALHRCGRRQEALRVFQQLRHSMIENLGLEPGKQLRFLQHAILSDDPKLEAVPRGDGPILLLDRLGRP